MPLCLHALHNPDLVLRQAIQLIYQTVNLFFKDASHKINNPEGIPAKILSKSFELKMNHSKIFVFISNSTPTGVFVSFPLWITRSALPLVSDYKPSEHSHVLHIIFPAKLPGVTSAGPFQAERENC